MSTTRPIEIIANPTSGRGRGRRTARRVASDLQCRGLTTNVRFTSQTGDALSFALEAADSAAPPGCVVACGGDGTVQEIAHALATLKAPMGDACPVLGLAPAGRCNDFARVLGVSRRPRDIAKILAEGSPRSIDLGKVNDRHFCTVATVGVDAEVTRFVDSMRMPLTGTVAYLYGAVRVLLRYRPYQLRITGDFGEINRPIFLASSANTSSYGGAIRIAPQAVPTDGKLDVCVIDAVSGWRVMTLVPQVLAGRHTTSPEVQIIRTSKLHIDSNDSLELWADGERIGQTPATLEAVPNAIRVMLRCP